MTILQKHLIFIPLGLACFGGIFGMAVKLLWEELDKALDELPQEQRDAFVMTEIKGFSTEEAARQMGVSQNTFLSRKLRENLSF